MAEEGARRVPRILVRNPMDAEKVVALAVVAVCAVLLFRLVLRPARRAAFDRRMLTGWYSLRRLLRQPTQWPRRWRARRQAQRAAQEVIRRVRQPVDKQGNVYTPESFKRPRKPH
jgi:peptidoglycan/LPS O-acetylase OafA/YrhL